MNRQLGKRAFVHSLLILCTFVVISSVALLGQETSGELNGVVKDNSGGVMPNVTVTITNKGTGRVFITKTGGDGSYREADLPPGRYSVKFELTGFNPVEVSEVGLLLGQKLKVDGSMQVAPVEQQVQVVETAPLIDLSSTTVGHNITSQEFDQLPKARNFQALLTTSPSVTSGLDQFGKIVGVEGGIQVNGSSSAENQFFIDGVATNSQLYGQQRQSAPFEFLEEVQVKTGTPEAEYGGALGGVATAVTKSGGNQFHGEGHYFFTGNGISAVSVQRLLSPLTVGVAGFNGATTGSNGGYVQDNKWDDNRHELGGSVGGPFWKDKMWFFLSASPTWRRADVPYNLTDGSDTIHQKQFYQEGFAKLSYDPTSKIRTNFSWLYTPTASTGNPPAYNGGTNGLVTSVKALQTSKQDGFYAPATSYRGSIDFIVSPKMLLNVTGGRFWDDYHVSGIPNITTWEYGNATSELTPALQAQVAAAGLTGGFGFGNLPRRQLVDHDLVTRTFVNGSMDMVGNLWGAHDMKLGIGVSKGVNNVNFAYPQGGYITAFWGQSFPSPVPGSPCAAGCTGTYGYYTIDDNGTRGSTGGTVRSIFAQDKWQIHQRLTLSYGVRFEDEKVPSFRRSVLDPAFEFSWTDKFMPRIGVAYDLFGNGKMKLGFGYGRFYDWIKYELARGTFGGDIWTTKYRSLDTLDLNSLNAGNLPGRDLWNPAVPNSFQDHRIPSFSKDCSATNLATCQIDPTLKPMGVDQLNVTAEYQLNAHTVLRASYVRSDLLHTIEDMGHLVNGDESYFYVNPGYGLLGTVMDINYPNSTKVPAALCNSRGLKGTDLSSCLAGLTFPTPKAERLYDALEISIARRFAERWFFNGSYVYSRLSGNYGGIANSDEIRTPTTGGGFAPGQQQNFQITRQGTSAGRAWDLDQYMFDAKGNPYVTGPLATDRPHQLKLYGSYNFKFGTQIGVNYFVESGTPISTYAFTTDRIRMLINDRGDMGRTPVFSQTDLLVGHEYKIRERKTLRFEANLVNLFNQKTSRHVYNCLNYDCVNGLVAASMNIGPVFVCPDVAHGGPADNCASAATKSQLVQIRPGVDLFKGFDYKDRINVSGNGIALNGYPGLRNPVAGAVSPFDLRYKKDDLFNPGFSARFGIKFIF